MRRSVSNISSFFFVALGVTCIRSLASKSYAWAGLWIHPKAPGHVMLFEIRSQPQFLSLQYQQQIRRYRLHQFYSTKPLKFYISCLELQFPKFTKMLINADGLFEMDFSLTQMQRPTKDICVYKRSSPVLDQYEQDVTCY